MRSRKYSDLLQHKFEFAIWTRGTEACASTRDLALPCACPRGRGRRLDRFDSKEAVENDLQPGFVPVEKRLRVEVYIVS